MSSCEMANIHCPTCNAEGTFQMWNSINREISPAAVTALVDGNLFKYTCQNCGANIIISYPCLYHDMNRKVMIQLVDNTEKKIKDAFEAFDQMMNTNILKEAFEEFTDSSEDDFSLGIDFATDYKYRLVTDVNSFREKVKLLEDDLDDRVIELMKFHVFILNIEKQESLSDLELYYVQTNEDSTLKLEAITTEGFAEINVPHDLYDSLFEYLLNRETEDKGLRIIDRQWAYEFFQEAASE